MAAAKLHALRRGIQATALQGKMDDAFKQLKPFLDRFPNEPEILQVHGWLLLQANKHQEAVKAYETLLATADGRMYRHKTQRKRQAVKDGAEPQPRPRLEPASEISDADLDRAASGVL